MPNRTIYVKESDQHVWDRAEQESNDSLSALVTEALRDYLSLKVHSGTLKMDDGKIYRVYEVLK